MGAQKFADQMASLTGGKRGVGPPATTLRRGMKVDPRPPPFAYVAVFAGRLLVPDALQTFGRRMTWGWATTGKRR